LVTTLKKEEGGFIIRTVCEGKETSEIAADVEYLRELWRGIQVDAKDKKAPKLIHQDLDLPLKAVRDLTTLDTERVIVDNINQCERIENFASRFMSSLELKIEHYKGPDTLFDAYGIDKEIDQALSRKVWLKSGGYIIIDQTEALVAIDVNTGKFVGKGNLEETILKTNLEAVHEIAYQIRLRNIGGIIIIDFIDMQKEASREKIFSALEESLKKDKAKTNLGKISEFGILEMTRKRTRANLNDVLTESCLFCEGRGFIKSKESICMEICRLIRKRVKRNPLHKNFKVSAHSRIIDILLNGSGYIENLQNEFDLKIELNAEQSYYYEQYEVVEDNRLKREIPINQPGEEEL
jgi:ribonuclease G